MSVIMHSRHRFTKISLRGRQKRLSRLLGGLLLWSLNPVWISNLGLSQTPVLEPTLDPDPAIELLPTQPPDPTYRKTDVPPRANVPPLFDAKTSRQFNVYRLNLGDGISVSVENFPEFSFSTTIDPDGYILVPILGKVPAVGLTLEEVEEKIAYELNRVYLQEKPKVIAVLVGPRPVQLTVLGEVLRPGFYPVDPNAAIPQVLSSAGGSTLRADLRSIIVRRPLVDGTILEERVDLYTPLIKGTGLPDFRLQNGDTIIVSKLDASQTQDYDRTLIARTTLAQPTMTVRVLVQVEPSGSQLRNITLPNGSSFIELVGLLPPGDPLRFKRDEVTLMRFDPEQGKVVTQSLNPEALILNGDISQNVVLQDQDVIITSRTLLGKILSAFRIITQPIRDVFSFTSFFRNISNGGGFF